MKGGKIYEDLFESLLQSSGVLYLRIDDSKSPHYKGEAIKSFDYIVSSFAGKFLIDVKGKTYVDTWIHPTDISGLETWGMQLTGTVPLLVCVFLWSDKVERWLKNGVDKTAYQGKEYGIVGIKFADYYARSKIRSGGKFPAIHVNRPVFAKLALPIRQFIPEMNKSKDLLLIHP